MDLNVSVRMDELYGQFMCPLACQTAPTIESFFGSLSLKRNMFRLIFRIETRSSSKKTQIQKSEENKLVTSVRKNQKISLLFVFDTGHVFIVVMDRLTVVPVVICAEI